MAKKTETPITTGLRARCLIRISEEDRNKPDTSPENQKHFCIQHIAKIGAELDHCKPFYMAINEKSWKPLSERPVTQEALKDAADYDLLIVKHLNRFARTDILETLLFTFNEAGIQVVPAVGDTDWQSIEVQKFTDNLMIKKLRNDARDLHANKQEQGMPVGRAPFGYKYGNTRVKKGTRYVTVSDGMWHPNPKEADAVRDVFKMKLAGAHWTDICKKHSISSKLLYKILNNKAYLGFIQYTKRIRNPGGQVVRTEDVEYEGVHEPIISQELWDKVHRLDK